MNKYPVFILIVLISTAILNAENSFDAKFGIKDKMDSEKSSKKAKLLWSFGTNLSSFLNEEGKWQLGYSIGFTFNFRVYKNLSVTLPFSYTRINAAPENVEGRTFPDFG
ncbi:MAG: hypothetical protein GWN01_06185, partial [Nitrosopumilaceae archaeon]|nr:hypothetical protein [Nitrosopumilaceae archaeon]NIX61129.1 hypothetical protein [Nitrosopumilaceae archaeon]